MVAGGEQTEHRVHRGQREPKHQDIELIGCIELSEGAPGMLPYCEYESGARDSKPRQAAQRVPATAPQCWTHAVEDRAQNKVSLGRNEFEGRARQALLHVPIACRVTCGVSAVHSTP